MLSPTLKHLRSSSLPLPKPKPKISSFSSSSQFSVWSGLQNWRNNPLNENRFWGPNGPEPLQNSSTCDTHTNTSIGCASSLAELGAIVLSTPDPLSKSLLSHLAFSKWRNLNLPIGVCSPPSRPARPPKPQLVCMFLFSFYLYRFLLCWACVFYYVVLCVNFRFPLKKFPLQKIHLCLLMPICFTTSLMWS